MRLFLLQLIHASETGESPFSFFYLWWSSLAVCYALAPEVDLENKAGGGTQDEEEHPPGAKWGNHAPFVEPRLQLVGMQVGHWACRWSWTVELIPKSETI